MVYKKLLEPPSHPAANDLGESAVKIKKTALLKEKHDSPNLDIPYFINKLLFQYRKTPQTTTGEKPTKLLLGQELRTKLDLLIPSVNQTTR